MTVSRAALAVGDVWTPEDASIGVGYGVFAVGFFAVAAFGVLAFAIDRLRRRQAADDLLAVAEYGPPLDAVQRAAAAAPGGTPDWASRDVDGGPGLGVPQVAYVSGDAWGNVERIFQAYGVALPNVHVVATAPVPPGPRDSWEHLDDIAVGLSQTQMLPIVGGPDQPVRLR